MSAVRDPSREAHARRLEAMDWRDLEQSVAPLTESQCEARRVWLADSHNRRAYERLAAWEAEGAQLDFSPMPTADAIEADSYDASVPLSRWQTLSRRPARRQHPLAGLGKAWAVGLMSAATAAVAVVAWRFHQPGNVGTLTGILHYETASGQTQTVRLADGSILTLGAGTALTVDYSLAYRNVSLARGEAWFQVVRRHHWPFVVAAGGGTITDVDTSFVVDRESDRVEVTVTQGEVLVALRRVGVSAPGVSPGPIVTHPIPLRVGERLSYRNGSSGGLEAVSPRAATAWTQGKLEFEDESLHDIAEDVGRYAHRPIRVSRAAGRLHLTTLVLSDHIRDWLLGLPKVLQVTTTVNKDGVCIRLRKPTNANVDNTCHASR